MFTKFYKHPINHCFQALRYHVFFKNSLTKFNLI
jgi:hypothetical protein